MNAKLPFQNNLPVPIFFSFGAPFPILIALRFCLS
jgi:hypothetical protein